MSRRPATKKKDIIPDRKYGSCLLAKFINCVMKNGKKSVAESLVYEALEALEKQMGANGLQIFSEALANVSPAVELRSLRAGGVNYRVPVPIKGHRSDFIGIRWLLGEAIKRKGMSSVQRLYLEIADAHAKRGGAYRKYEENLKVAESSRAFSHFRFFNRSSSNANTNTGSDKR